MTTSLLPLSCRILATAALLSAASLSNSQAQSVAPDWQWVKRMPLASSGIQASVTDAATGSSYVAGDFYGTGTFGDQVFTSTNNSPDGFIIKHDAQGNILWASQIGGTSGSEKPAGLALDASGNLYVLGTASSALSFSPGATFNPTGGGSNVYVAKYNPAGTILWIRRVGAATTPADALTSRAISVSPTGMIYVAAELKGRATFDAVQLENSTGTGPVLLQLAPDGVVQWARAATIATAGSATTGTELTYEIGVDASGAPYLGGSFSGSLGFGSYTVTAPLNRQAVFLTHYSVQGAPQWASQSAATSSNASFGGLVTDATGNSYLTGSFGDDSDLNATFGTSTLTSKGGTDAFIAQYNAAGALRWVNGFGSKNYDRGSKVILAPGGGVIIAGGLGSGVTTVSPGLELTGTGDKTSLYLYLARFTDQGTAQWVQQAGGSSSVPAGLGMDNAGNLYVRGQAEYGTTFGNVPTPALAGSSFVARLSNTVLSTQTSHATQALALYPSPASGAADVQLGALPKGTVLHLSDALGRVVCQQTVGLEPAHLTLPGLRAGLYALKATAPSGDYYTGRLVVE